MKFLWRWYPNKDAWELVTQATADMARKVLAKYKRRDARTARYKWTATEKAPKRFRTRTKRRGRVMKDSPLDLMTRAEYETYQNDLVRLLQPTPVRGWALYWARKRGDA